MPPSLIVCLAALLLSAAVEAREPHRPPERGTFFIPLERIGFGSDEDDQDADDARAYPLAGPAEAALAEIENAEAIARALRALVALDAQRVREAPDMAAALSAHLPRYRLAEDAALHDAPDGDAVARLADGHLLILMSRRGAWREVFDAQAHRIGWLPRATD